MDFSNNAVAVLRNVSLSLLVARLYHGGAICTVLKTILISNSVQRPGAMHYNSSILVRCCHLGTKSVLLAYSSLVLIA
jgi:hypothetical protein